MKTVYCVDCLLVIRQFFTERASGEDLLAGICEPCKVAWKEDMDEERRLLHVDRRLNPVVNRAREILHAQGVST